MRPVAPKTGKLGLQVIDEDYLAYLRELSFCGICGRRRKADEQLDPHHVINRATGESKRNDYLCVAICRKCHNDIHGMGLQRTLDINEVLPQELVREVVEALTDFLRGKK